MDRKTEKRIDSLYRNLRQLPVLGCLGILIPLLGVVNLLIALAYFYLRRRLLKDVDQGRISFGNPDDGESTSEDLATEEKVRFIRGAVGSLAFLLLTSLFWISIFLAIVAKVEIFG